MSSPTSFPNPHVPERRFRYQLSHDALAELQKSLDAGEQDRFYFHKDARTMEAPQSRPQESERDDKWSFCLTAGTLCPVNQEKQ